MTVSRWFAALLLILGTVQAGGGARGTPVFKDCRSTSALSSLPSVDCRWSTPSGTVRVLGDPRNAELRLTGYDRTGKLVWAEANVRFIQRLLVLDGVLLISTSNHGIGAYITTHTALISPRGERPVWVWGSFLVHSAADHQTLLTQEDVRAPQEEDGLNFQRAVLTPEIRVYPVHFPSPSRRNCGNAQGFYEQFGQPQFGPRYIHVERQDRCGRFITRFDWTAPETPPLQYSLGD